jgi:ABC-2 type transport system ATP-binding protein
MIGLSMREVVKSYGDFTLGPVTAEFGTGVTALLGANGAGKSTLIRLAVGLIPPDSGEVVTGSTPLRRKAGDVGYLPQDFSGPKSVRVSEYLTFIAWCRSGKAHKIGAVDVARALERVNLSEKAGARIGALSGGMVRRLGVAQALLGGTTMLLLDEPTVGLDPVQRRELRELLAHLGGDTTVVVSTHLSEDVAAIADTVCVLADGKVVFSGSADDLCARAGRVEVTGDNVESGFLSVILGEPADVGR